MNAASNKTSSDFIDFGRLLTVEECAEIENPAHWQWLSSFGSTDCPPIPHRRHEAWIRVKGNTHAPALREILFTLQGEAVYSFQQNIYLRKPGTVILLDKYERRDLKGAAHKKNFGCLWLQFLGRDRITYHVSRCDRRGRYQHNPAAVIRTGEAVCLISAAWDHLVAHPSDRMGANLLRSSIVTFILEILGHTAPTTSPNAQAQIISSVVEYIHAHLGDELSLPSLARLAGYSQFFFHRLFVRHTGQTPVSYINAARLILAKELLLKNHTVEAVAEAVGLSSVSYFNHFFKKRTGFAPRGWTKAQIS